MESSMFVPGKPCMPERLGPNPQSYDTGYSHSRGWGPQGCLGQFQGGQTSQNQTQRAQVGLPEVLPQHLCDRIPSTTPGAEPPRDARDSGSARSHSAHLETSSSDRP